MKFNLTAMALAGGLFWGAAISCPRFGEPHLAELRSRRHLTGPRQLYPGYHPGAGVGSV